MSIFNSLLISNKTSHPITPPQPEPSYSIEHLLHFCTLSIPKHPDDTLSEKTKLWTYADTIPTQSIKLASTARFHPSQVPQKLQEVKDLEKTLTLCQNLLEQLNRTALNALALDSTLKEHRTLNSRISSVDYLDLELPRGKRLSVLSNRLNAESKKVVEPQSHLELRCATLPTEKKLSLFDKAISWITTPLNTILKHNRKIAPQATVALPCETKRFMQKTYQGISPKNPQLLGKGAFGEVHAVSYGNDHYAIKQALSTPSLAKNALEIESSIHMSLQHPNIVSIKAYSQEGPYLEKIDGGDLKKLILHKEPRDLKTFITNLTSMTRSQKILPARTHLITYLIDIADALIHVHKQGYTYKDVKAENILIDTASHRAKLCDFGFTRSSSTDTEISGTPYYRAPELEFANIYKISNKCDSWSFGVLLYHCITNGSFPFLPLPEEKSPAYLTRLAKELYNKPCDRNQIFSHLKSQAKSCIHYYDENGDLQKLITDCLHGNPKERLSMTAVKERLSDLQKKTVNS